MIRAALMAGVAWLALLAGDVSRVGGQGQTGQLYVRSTPAAANVTIEGPSIALRRGRTPYGPHDLPIGPYKVTLSTECERRTVKVIVRPELTSVVDESLGPGACPSPASTPSQGTTPWQGTIKIRTEPTGATVVLDGAPMPKRTPIVVTVGPGRHRVRLILTGHQDYVEQNVEVVAGRESSVAVVLKPEPPSLVVWALAGGAALLGIWLIGWLVMRLRRRTRRRTGRCTNVDCRASVTDDKLLYACAHCRDDDGSEHRFLRGAHGCDRCGRLSLKPVCPTCRNPLPLGFLGTPTQVIAVVGAPQSGKTFFLMALIEAFQRGARTMRGRPMGLQFADLATTELVRTHRLQLSAEGTIKSRRDLAEPLAIRLVHRRRAPIGLLFYDIQGDVFSDPQAIEETAPYFADASGIILLLSAEQLRHPEQQEGNRSEAWPETPDGLLSSVVLYRDHHRHESIGRAPLAVVLTKIDHLVDMKGVLNRRDRDEGALNQRLRDLVQFQMGGFVASAEFSFDRVRYFAAQMAVLRDGRWELKPLGVDKPLMWILEESGALPSGNWLLRLGRRILTGGDRR